MILKDLGEFGLIDRISKRIRATKRVIKGIGDDTCVLRYVNGKYLLFTVDCIMEGRHFKSSTSPYLIGRKSLAINLSDIAAMGGRPTSFVVSLGVSKSLKVSFLDELYRGIKSLAEAYNVDLVGGNIIESKNLMISIALLGEVGKKKLVLRSGAKNGDSIFITGSIGGSIKGKHLTFTPRLEEARFLVNNFKINSMIDVSDGLLADLGHVLESSKAGCIIHRDSVPLSKQASDFDSGVMDGEDFELLFTISNNIAPKLIKTWPFKTKLSKIGEVTLPNKGMTLIASNGKIAKLNPKGFVHF